MIEKFDFFPKPGVPERNYLNALYGILCKYKPKLCLEIGTNYGYSANVFSKYFENCCADGSLITCDIKKYCDISDQRVKQLIVYPHITNSTQYHYVTAEEILNPANLNTIVANIALIKQYNQHPFDLIFIDGDHTKPSILADIQIAKELSHDKTIIVVDDINAENHDVKDIYYNTLCKEYSHYELDGLWNEYVDIGVLYKNEI